MFNEYFNILGSMGELLIWQILIVQANVAQSHALTSKWPMKSYIVVSKKRWESVDDFSKIVGGIVTSLTEIVTISTSLRREVRKYSRNLQILQFDDKWYLNEAEIRMNQQMFESLAL